MKRWYAIYITDMGDRLVKYYKHWDSAVGAACWHSSAKHWICLEIGNLDDG